MMMKHEVEHLRERNLLILSRAPCPELSRRARSLGFSVTRSSDHALSLRALREQPLLVALFDTDDPPMESMAFAISVRGVSKETPILYIGHRASDEAARVQRTMPDLAVGATAEPAQALLAWGVALRWRERGSSRKGDHT